MTVSPVASSEKIQTALTKLGTPNGFIAYDVVPLMQQLVVALGNITSGGGSGSAITGEGKLWFSDTPPAGWLICDGSQLNTADYPALYAVIGNIYGGNTDVFNLPDLRNHVPVGNGSGTFSVLGGTAGNETVSITSTNLPVLETSSSGASAAGDFEALTSVSYSATPGTSISVIQPSLVVNFIIKT